MKRLIDYSCIAVGIFLFGPIGIVIAIIVYLEDRGKILFRQERIGKNGRPICVLKFRTMQEGKVTRVGRILRPCGLDEIPQLLNVFRGDMNIVGPRPLTKEDVQRLGWSYESDRWDVAPGLTGLAQVYAGRGARHSLRLDRLYARNAGLVLDLKIIFISLLMNFFGKRRVQRLVLKRQPERGRDAVRVTVNNRNRTVV